MKDNLMVELNDMIENDLIILKDNGELSSLRVEMYTELIGEERTQELLIKYEDN